MILGPIHTINKYKIMPVSVGTGLSTKNHPFVLGSDTESIHSRRLSYVVKL